MPPLVSVVIPNYNYAAYLRQAIDSVLTQSYANVEVIVVDDGSTDDSAEVLDSYGDRIRWFRQKNSGVSVARNRGIEEARGKYIAFLDADDFWRPEKLAHQVPLFSNASVGMVYCGIEHINLQGQSLASITHGMRGHVLEDVAQLTIVGIPAHSSTAVFRKSALDQLGGFDERISTSADWDMFRRVSCHFAVEFVPEALVLYRIHGSGMHLNVARMEHDMLLGFEKMFQDPAAAEIHPLRRRCYAKLYLTISGSYLQAGNRGRALQYALRSVVQSPAALGYVLMTPIRRIGRRLSILKTPVR
jgi:glycosyltransferase involved in cell wall biosynthesis